MANGASPVRQSIQGYGSGAFTVSGRRYSGAVAVLPFRTLAWHAPADAASLTAADLAAVIEELRVNPGGIEIVIVGLGVQVTPPPPAVLQPLRDALRGFGATLDVMDTGAACRTFNLLLGEGRRPAALLAPLP